MLRYGGMVCLESGHTRVLPFEELRDPDTGRTRVRLVDIDSEHYKVAREYMIRLGQEDLADPEMQVKLPEVAKLSPAEFREKFKYALGLDD